MVLCAGLAVWAGAVQWRVKQCLDGELDDAARAASFGITERGCEITTDSGAAVIAIGGPPFEVGVAAVLGVVLGLTLVVVTVRSRRRLEGRAFPG